ncbi:MAG: hypothetical protein LPK88_11505 [Alphaproteobacteria bacterium]|nr:hypothetical protein [Alphaproteobacteria bacterium]MDX5416924.1 hypothetical protein [Alphaproteobacteria bacterium]MDX5494322.1 hypothetical protein [Alphaproteobacteria bacterium]
MIFWRVLAVFLGLPLMCGELYRSWGMGRPIVFVLDDFAIGIPLVVTGLLMARDTFARRAAFAGAWGGTAGMLYPSFFGKLIEPTPEAAATTNIPFDQLTIIIGIIFALSLAGLVASVALKQRIQE